MGLAQSALVSSFDFQEAIAAGKRMAEEAVVTPSPGSRKEATYFSFKSNFQLESYILKAKKQHLRRIIAEFRTGQHWLRVQTGRYAGLKYAQCVCERCASGIDDEDHAIFTCAAYKHLRERYADVFSSNHHDLNIFRTKINAPYCALKSERSFSRNVGH